MKSKLVSLFAVLALAPLHAQNLTFNSVTGTPTDSNGGTGIYRATELGQNFPDGEGSPELSYNAFNVTVGTADGSAAALAGQSFLAFCINLRYESPAANEAYTYSTDPADLSYAPGGTEFWDAGGFRAEKYAAIRNIIATFGSDLAAMNQNDPEFQDWIVAMNFAVSEIIADYENTPLSLDLLAGNNQFRLANGDPVSGSVSDKYEQIISARANGLGESSTLHTANIGGTTYQDVILIPVPEPSVVSLAGIVVSLGMLRRRRL